MFKREDIKQLENFALPISERGGQYVYFCRLINWNSEVRKFLHQYYKTSVTNGIIIDGKIQNPNESNLSYYSEILGSDFQLNPHFFSDRVKKWLPRLSGFQNQTISNVLYDVLIDLKRAGKTDSMLNSAFVKFMCWMYYKFEPVIRKLGGVHPPKILYVGEISKYELDFFRILNAAGVDILLLQPKGDSSYQRLDPSALYSQLFSLTNSEIFPTSFSIQTLREDLEKSERNNRLLGDPPSYMSAGISSVSTRLIEAILVPPHSRWDSNQIFSNYIGCIRGVEDKLTYQNELHSFYIEVTASKRSVLVIEGGIATPTVDEINSITRSNHKTAEELLLQLSRNVQMPTNKQLQALMCRAFLDTMLELQEHEQLPLNRLTNHAVILLCWLKRYQKELFGNWALPQISVLVYLGVCKSQNEKLFFQMMSALPVDILILSPDLNQICQTDIPRLIEEKFPSSLTVEHFPTGSSRSAIGTAAYHAEQDLTTILYTDSGMYRDQQYDKADSLILHTTYEEIRILWQQEMKYRPNFSSGHGRIQMPVIFAKVCGCSSEIPAAYWSSIKELETEDTILISSVPYLTNTSANPIKAFATQFYKNQKLAKSTIRAHKNYAYGFLRESVQAHILEKLQLILDEKLIRGIGENGMEYTVISTALNLDKKLLRLIQKQDFTRKNPKAIYIHTSETSPSVEDSILLLFLSLLGFDIVVFVPTGYQSIEAHCRGYPIEEHIIGTYQYDMSPPDFRTISANSKSRWSDNLFRRGG